MSTTWIATTRQPGATGNGDVQAGKAEDKYGYLVQFSDGLATVSDARNANGIPAYGTALVTQTLGTLRLYVTDIQASQHKERDSLWDVVVTYSTLDPNRMPPVPSGFTSGDKFGTQVTMRGQPYSETVQVDANGKACVNSNNEPVAVTRTKHDREMHIAFYTDKIPQGVIDGAIDCANSSAVAVTIGSSLSSYGAGTLYFQDYEWGTTNDANGAPWLHVDYEFIYRKDGWITQIPNESFYSSTANGLVPLLDAAGQPFSEPRMLSSLGAVIPSGSSAYMLNFTTVPLVSFSSLLAQIP